MTFKKTIAAFVVFGIFVIPFVSLAQTPNPGQESSIIPCGKSVIKDGVPQKDAQGRPLGECRFEHIFELINNLIRFMLFRLAIPLATLSFMYAGFLYLTSGGSTSQAAQAQKIFTDTAWGFLIAISAYFIVSFIFSFVNSDFSLLNNVNVQ